MSSENEYERQMATSLLLHCIALKNTKDAWISINNRQHRTFGDVILYRQTTDDEELVYSITLKRDDAVTATEIIKVKSAALLLTKYFDDHYKTKPKKDDLEGQSTINYLRENRHKVVFVMLGTTKTHDGNLTHELAEGSVLDTKWRLSQTFPDATKICRFNYEKLDEVLDANTQSLMARFFLCIDDMLEASVSKAAERFIQPVEVPTSLLMSFINRWMNEDLMNCFNQISKSYFEEKLIHFLLEPFSLNLTKFKADRVFQQSMWVDIMKNKDVTVIDGADSVVVQFIQDFVHNAVRRHQKENFDNLAYDGAYEALWKASQVPLVLQVTDQQEAKQVQNILCKFPGMVRVIILYKQTDLWLMKRSFSKQFMTLKDLELHHQEAILKLPVKLQGRQSVVLGSYVEPESRDLLTVKDVIYILTDQFSLLDELEKLPDCLMEMCIGRRLIKAEALQKLTHDEHLVIKSDSMDHFNALLDRNFLTIASSHIFHWRNVANDYSGGRIIVFQDDQSLEEIHNYFCCTTKPVHYLILHQDNGLEWVRTQGTVKNLKQFQESGRCASTIVDKGVCGGKQRPVVLSGKPGAGKSIFLDYIARNSSTTSLVLKANLAEHQETYRRWTDNYFINCNSEKLQRWMYITEQLKLPSLLAHLQVFAKSVFCDKEQTEQMFKEIVPHRLEHFRNLSKKSPVKEDSLSDRVLQAHFHSRNVIFLLDGFDEIPAGLQQGAKNLLRFIHSSGYPICVTTRPYWKDDLETLLDTIAVELNPAIFSQQLSLLTTNWNVACNPSTSNEKLLLFVQKLLGCLDPTCDLIGAPLRLKLLAQAFGDDWRKFLETDTFDHHQISLVYLVQNFIEQTKPLPANQSVRHPLQVVFEEDDLKREQFPSVPEPLVQNNRIFAEYLAAKWLADNLNGNRREKVIKLVKITFQPDYDLVRYFFNAIVARDCPLHLAIINGRVDQAKEMIRFNQVLLEAHDRANRSVLHLIASCGSASEDDLVALLEAIPDGGAKNLKDSLLSFTPLDYAVISGSFKMANAISARLQTNELSFKLRDINYMLRHGGRCGYDLETFSRVVYQNPNQKLINKPDRRKIQYLVTAIMIYHGAFNNTPDSDKEDASFIYLAVTNAHKEIVDLLLRKKTTDQSNLRWLAVEEQKQIWSLLLSPHDPTSIGSETSSRLEASDWNRRTQLHWAAFNGHLSIVKLLVSKGASCASVTINGLTPLHYAVMNGQVDVADFLLTQAGNSEPVTSSTVKSLHHAAYNGYQAIVELLLARGFDKDVKTYTLLTPLHCAAINGHKEIIELLLCQGSDKEAKTMDTSWTALQWAAYKGHKDVVDFLQTNGASMDAKDNSNKTALHWAACNGHQDAVRLLLRKGADQEATDCNGMTPLHWAAQEGHTKVAQDLLATGANIHAKDNAGMTSLHWAVRNGRKYLFDLLVSNNADMEAKDGCGLTPLHWAVRNGHHLIMDLLLSKGADKEAQDDKAMTLLHWASQAGHNDVVHLLLFLEINTEAKDVTGLTPLHWAARNGHVDSVKLLITNGADLEAQDEDGLTPLHWAARNDRAEVVSLLLTKGGRISKDKFGRTPLDWARRNYNQETIDLLLKVAAESETSCTVQ